MAAAPSLQAIWIADNAFQNEDGKVTVSGMFDRIDIDYPATSYTRPAVLFFCLRDVRGIIELTLRYVDLDDNSVLKEKRIPVQCESPMLTQDVRIDIKSIPIPHTGVFAWELLCKGTMLGCCQINAYVANPPSDGHTEVD
jgi:hypothetical protein